MSTPGVRRRLISATYEGGRAKKQLFEDSPIAVYDALPLTEDVADFVARMQMSGGNCDSFFVMDACAVDNRLLEWQRELPFVEPFFPISCNDDPILLNLLTRRGQCHLQASSLADLERALLLVDPSRITFNCPLLTKKTMRMLSILPAQLHAVVVGDEKSAMDMAEFCPYQPLLLRVSLSPESERVSLSLGVYVEDAEDVMERLISKGVAVGGVSMQLQTGDIREDVHRAMIVRGFIASCQKRFPLGVVDIGGGFGLPTIRQSAQLLADHMGQFNIKMMATPGRFFASSAFSLVTSVTGKSEVDAALFSQECASPRGFVYQTNESVYGALGGILGGHSLECRPLGNHSNSPHYSSAVLGSASDPIDIPQRRGRLPSLSVGDWLLWKEAGAYGARDEDGLAVYYYTQRDHWDRLHGVETGTEEEEGGLLSDGASDIDSGDDDDDMTPCFYRVFRD